tara:strand:- start:8207 stop:8464 length:258 start_codon:yes stop_codon:yes gene_type:complete
MCEHPNIIEEYQTFKNGTKHLRRSCRDCNKFLGFVQQELSDDYVLHFGKYKGNRVKDIDREYLIWLHKQDIKENLKNLIAKICFL